MTVSRGFKAAVGITVLAAAVAVNTTSSVHGAPSPPTQDVRVVNTTAQPVPTSPVGTTSVSGSVGASQSGPWSVGIAGTASVTPTREPVMFQPSALSCIDPTCYYIVPAGKRLVVEQVYVYFEVEKDSVVQVVLRISGSQNIAAPVYIAKLASATLGYVADSDVFVTGGPMRAYAGPGDRVGLTTMLRSGSLQGFNTPFFIGYLEPAS